jgi:hypothetical protein
MTDYCQDIDLMGIEPAIFLATSPPGQALLAGSAGAISGTTFTASGVNFQAAGVAAGMVLTVHRGNVAEGSAYEIVSVDGIGRLTVSVLRFDGAQPPTAPPTASGLSFLVRTFRQQIHRVCASLGEKLRSMVESSPVRSAGFADSMQLRLAAATGTIATLLVASAERATVDDPNWVKAQHYHNLFNRMQSQLRLAIDVDGDGLAEQTRSLGNVTLRRI